MGRVTTLDPGSVVLSAGTLNLKRFEQRRGETLVLGELLDRRVQVAETGRPATVVDAGIEQTRTGDWVLSRLAVQEPGRLDRESTRLNSSHANISYAVFCLKKKQ